MSNDPTAPKDDPNCMQCGCAKSHHMPTADRICQSIHWEECDGFVEATPSEQPQPPRCTCQIGTGGAQITEGCVIDNVEAHERAYPKQERPSETDKITCNTCGRKDVPNWKDGNCIKCARDKVLGATPPPKDIASGELDELIKNLYCDAFLNGFNTQESKDGFDISKFSEPRAEAKSALSQLMLEEGTKFLISVGDDDKIEAWKKYLNNGDL